MRGMVDAIERVENTLKSAFNSDLPMGSTQGITFNDVLLNALGYATTTSNFLKSLKSTTAGASFELGLLLDTSLAESLWPSISMIINSVTRRFQSLFKEFHFPAVTPFAQGMIRISN